MAPGKAAVSIMSQTAQPAAARPRVVAASALLNKETFQRLKKNLSRRASPQIPFAPAIRLLSETGIQPDLA